VCVSVCVCVCVLIAPPSKEIINNIDQCSTINSVEYL
jgi:hypothetical protein